jgi:NTP pyrophosphatase (non-canonical NTP hydrolase)
MTNDFSPLTVGDYAAQALTMDQRSDSGSLIFALLGLFGETGSLLSEVKKKQRDRASYIGYAGAVVEELGDVLWYLTAVAARGGLALSDIAANVGRGYSDWQGSGIARSRLRPCNPKSCRGQPSQAKPLKRRCSNWLVKSASSYERAHDGD